MGNVDNFVKSNATTVLDVLDLLSVRWGLLEGLDDEGGGRGHHRYLSLTVLDGQLHGGLQTLPVLGGLGNSISNRLLGETEGTDCGGQR